MKSGLVFGELAGSPGRAPKSTVQRNLARLGTISSPDCKGLLSTLEEFMEQLVDGKSVGLEEEDAWKQVAAQYQMTLLDITKWLFEQATEEQRKGTKRPHQVPGRVAEAVCSLGQIGFRRAERSEPESCAWPFLLAKKRGYDPTKCKGGGEQDEAEACVGYIGSRLILLRHVGESPAG